MKSHLEVLRLCFPFKVPAMVAKGIAPPSPRGVSLLEQSTGDGLAGIISGATGAGKTIVAGTVALRLAQDFARRMEFDLARVANSGRDVDLAREYMPVLFIGAVDLERAQFQEQRREPVECDVLNLAERARLLVVDDLGWESNREFLKLVVARRYNAGERILVTTGLDQNALVERYGDAFVRRIVEAGGPGGAFWEL